MKKKVDSNVELTPKAEQLSLLIGEYVSLKLKNMQTLELIPETESVAVSISSEGYIADVTNEYVYISDNRDCEDFHTMIDIVNIGGASIVDNIPDELKDMGFVSEGDLH